MSISTLSRTASLLTLLSVCSAPFSAFGADGEDPAPKPPSSRRVTDSDSDTSAEDTTQAEVDPATVALKAKVRECLATYFERRESVADHSPWGIMHTLIAFGVDTEIYVQDRKVNAIGWLCWNQPCRGMRLFYTSNGKLRTKLGPGVQGHAGQFLAMLAQSRVPRDFSIKVNGHEFTVQDLVELEKQTCRPNSELTFKLIGLSHYLKSDETWKSDDGQTWSVSRLIQEELKQSVIGAACGGTHRMMGFTYALKKRRQRKEKIDGQWSRADKFVKDFHAYTFKLQNKDGSFSTNWFEGRGASQSVERIMQTSGHTLEWLSFSVEKKDLKDPRLVKAVDRLATLLLENKGRDWEIGPLGHAVHALAIYDERAFGGKPGKRAEQLAKHRSEKRVR